MASLVDKYFSKIDFDAIEAAVVKAESATGGEIAVEITSHSYNWLSERLIHSVLFGLVCGLAAFYLTIESNWGTYYNFTQTALWFLVGNLATFFGWGQFLRRRSRRQRFVWNKAADRFSRLTPVRNLTGVMIFLSLEENEAAIVADKGIASKVSPDFWPKIREALVEDMMRGQHAEGLIRAIEAVGAELSRFFPRPDDDVNELPNRPEIVD